MLIFGNEKQTSQKYYRTLIFLIISIIDIQIEKVELVQFNILKLVFDTRCTCFSAVFMVYTNHLHISSEVQILALLLISFGHETVILCIELHWADWLPVFQCSLKISEPEHVPKMHMQNMLTCLTIC